MRISQRVVVNSDFNGTESRFHCIRVEGDEEHRRVSKDELFGVWFAKALDCVHLHPHYS